MAEAGSFADRVKQQADIVRVIGEYVRLKKSGQNFTGLCTFHGEKTPSFAVHPVKQIFHCFGCGKGGDVFSFVMEMEKCPFPEAVKVVAEKCGIPVPRAKERTPEERKENQQRAALIEIHREAQAFFARQLESTAEGRAARAYLEDRGVNAETIAQFGIGYAPSGGDVVLRQLKPKYAEKLLVESGVISRDQSGARLFDRFRRRITFPIANESGKIVAFGCRALGDDLPKYLNSPETPIYSKSNVLYHMDRAKEPIRRQDFAILVEGYMDAIAVARAGIGNVVASCGTSLAEPQIKLLGRFTKRVIVNYDPDVAGQAATERSLTLLLEQDFEVRVLALPAIGDKKADPDLFIREKGAEAYIKLLKEAPPYVDYLIARARQMDLSTGEGKQRALNFLMPYVQRIPNRLLPFACAQVHLPRPRDQVIHIRGRFLQQFDVRLRSLFADKKVWVGFLVANRWQRQHTHLEILLQQQRQRTLRRRLPRHVRVIIHNHALREPPQQFNLRLCQAGAATRHHVADSRPRHGNRVHVAFHQNREILPPDRLFRAVHVIEHVALRINRCLRRIQIFWQ